MKEPSKLTWTLPMPVATVDRGDTLGGGRTSMMPTRQMKTCETTDVSPHVAGTAAPTPRATVTGTAVGTARTTGETATIRVDTDFLAPTACWRMITPLTRDDRPRSTRPKMTPEDLLLSSQLLQRSPMLLPRESSRLRARPSQRSPIQ